VAATSTGFGIWATHFIAMLAFSPGLPSAYNISLTVLSLAVAIIVTGLGLAVATGSNAPAARHGSEAPSSERESRPCTSSAWLHSRSRD
jgi:NO-binding membrane sensor protein with MHYT domain